MANEFKLMLLGASAAGKTCLTVQLVSSFFLDQHDHTVEDSYRKSMVVDDEPLMLDIFDPATMEEFSAMREHALRTSDAYVLVFDVTSRSSFDELSRCLAQIARVKAVAQTPLVVVANKVDLEHERVVSASEASEYAASIGAGYVEASAKWRLNIEEIFAQAVREVRHRSPAAAQAAAGAPPKLSLREKLGLLFGGRRRVRATN